MERASARTTDANERAGGSGVGERATDAYSRASDANERADGRSGRACQLPTPTRALSRARTTSFSCASECRRRASAGARGCSRRDAAGAGASAGVGRRSRRDVAGAGASAGIGRCSRRSEKALAQERGGARGATQRLHATGGTACRWQAPPRSCKRLSRLQPSHRSLFLRAGRG